MIKLSFLEAIEILKKLISRIFVLIIIFYKKRKQLAPKKYEMLANFRKCPNPVTIAIEVDCNVHNIVIFLLDLVKDLVIQLDVSHTLIF